MKMTAIRQEQRISAVLPVRVSGFRDNEPFTSLAHTLNISHGGALLSGLEYAPPAGSVICIHRGPKQEKFRILWTSSSPQMPLQIGVERLYPIGDFWNLGRRVSSSQVDEFLAMLDRASTDAIFF